ncbi:hypothetical protein [Flammeovirga sp. SubArs3]|uniref:hypothetical protein n=1 Tax=Flammeovirga sp. SubArs3 TaxID=2995316 RepID=UPI00248BCE80|nr:hypothetical protein [Flammeovirga sp. SubArs3]
MKNKLLVLLSCLLITLVCQGQTESILFNKVTTFQLNPHQSDSINFIVVDTKLEEKKPIFLFCQGSLPIPMFMDIPNRDTPFLFGGGISNFDIDEVKKKYHLVVINMPHTPLVVDSLHLSPYGNYYIEDPSKPSQISEAFTNADYLDNYVQRGLEVLQFLKRQPWVDTSKVVVFGHSQGSKVATKLALKNKDIKHIGLGGANPFGRIDQYVRTAKVDAQHQKISWTEAEERINSYYKYYEDSFQPDSVAKHSYLKGINTFSEPLFDDWLQLDVPIFLTYGTEDHAAALCDLIPLFFIEKGKKNLTIKRWYNCDHNYFPLDENGRPKHKEGHWNDVIKRFLEEIELKENLQ